MMTNAAGAAKFLLTYSDKTDLDILTNDGRSFLAVVRRSIEKFTDMAAESLQHPDRLLFQVKQWEEVEKLLVERGV
jgi:hypothetical protein